MQTAFRHEAIPLADLQAFVETCSSAVLQALDRGDRTLVIARTTHLDGVRQRLADASADTSFVAADEHARNPGRIVSMLHRFSQEEPERHCYAAIDASCDGRTAPARAEMLLGECVLNSRQMSLVPLTVACMIDTGALDDARLERMRRCHPNVAGLRENHDFDAAWATELHAGDLPAPPERAEELVIDARRLETLRAFVRETSAGHALAPDRVDDLVLAANEAVANSMRHGGGRATVRVWTDDTGVVCEIRDHGYVRDPMTGRLPPPPTADHGRGLWLMHHLCDLVQLRSSESHGTTVRLFIDR